MGAKAVATFKAADELELAARYIHEVSGIQLGPSKRYLLKQRLHPVMAAFGEASMAGLVARARRDASGDVRRAILDAITTQETSFFRDPGTFAWLAKRWLIPPPPPGRSRVDIWCAACSTGQEPYSLAMLVHETCPPDARARFRIVATDVSRPALAQAEAGRFSRAELARGLSSERRDRFFETEAEGGLAHSELRDLIVFKRLNLAGDWTGMGSYDVILLRHVLIYFDPDTRRRILERLVSRLRPGGAVVLGATEPSIDDLTLIREREDGVTLYRKR